VDKIISTKVNHNNVSESDPRKRVK